jgi:hypothetical protein
VLYSILACYRLFWYSSVIECSHSYYGYNCNESCDGCLRENGVCIDTSGCKPRRQLGQLMKCSKHIKKPIYYLFFIYDEVTYLVLKKDIKDN